MTSLCDQTNIKRIDYSENITVLVGPEEKAYILHTSVLTAQSTFFRAAVEGGFKESKEKVIRLPEIDTESWSTYLQWIYSNEVVVLNPEEIDNDGYGVKRRNRLITLYLLADAVDDLTLRNKIVDEYVKVFKSTRLWECENISVLLNSVSESNKFRELILDFILRSSPDSAAYLQEISDQLPKSFLLEVATTLLTMALDLRNMRMPTKTPACEYHEHDDNFPRCP